MLKNLLGDKKEARRRLLREEAHAAQSGGDLPAELRARRALAEREDSPWYPSMRLFRQTRGGDWAGVIERVAAALESYTPA